jgi:hypothetical protein
MSIDKFGHYSSNSQFSSIFKRELENLTGVYLDSDGHINVQQKRVKNSSLPKNDFDLTIKAYVDGKVNELKALQEKTIIKAFDQRNTRITVMEDNIIRLINLMANLDKIMDTIIEKINNLNRFVSKYLKKPAVKSSTIQIDSTLIQDKNGYAPPVDYPSIRINEKEDEKYPEVVIKPIKMR